MLWPTLKSSLQTHNEQCEKLKAEIDQLNTALGDKTQLYDSLLKKSQEFGSPDALHETIEDLQTELLEWQQKDKLAQERQNDLNAQLQQAQQKLQLSQLHNNEQQEHIKMLQNELEEYRSQKENIGAVLMKARRDADDLLLETQKKCGQSVAEAVKYINALRRLFEKYTEQVKIEKAHILNSTDRVHQEIYHIFGYIANAQNTFEDIIGFVKLPEDFKPDANKTIH